MSTTAIFAELVVGGLQSMAWIYLILLTFLTNQPQKLMLNGEVIDAGIVLAIAYSFGVIFDRVWDMILDITGINHWIRNRSNKRPLSEADIHRRTLYQKDATIAAEFLNYNRCRMRVARASMFNFSLLALSICIYGRSVDLPKGDLKASVFTTACVAMVSAWAFFSLSQTYETCLRVVG